MRAKAKTALLTMLLVASPHLFPEKATADEHQDRCAYMATINADKLHQALTSYAGKVMGKDPEHWSDVDYANLAANAASCDGQPANVVEKVNAEFWRVKLADAQMINADINRASIAIAAAYGGFWKSKEEFPACATFLKWKKNDIWYTNNSRELFGTAFMDMTPTELGFYKRVVTECQPVMGSILDRWRKHPSQAEGIVKSILASIETDALAAGEKEMDVPQNLRIRHDGERVPLSYLRPTTRKVVEKIIMLENTNRVMPTNSLIQISKWASQVEENEDDGPDLMYAKVVKDIVADHMFRSVNRLKTAGGSGSGGE